jgi:hypothetical protein
VEGERAVASQDFERALGDLRHKVASGGSPGDGLGGLLFFKLVEAQLDNLILLLQRSGFLLQSRHVIGAGHSSDLLPREEKRGP